MSALNSPAVKRVREILKTYNSEAIIIELEETARTANDAAKNIGTVPTDKKFRPYGYSSW